MRYESHTEYTPGQGAGELPFDLEDLCKSNDLLKLTSSFDLMKRAIEYLLKNQNGQGILLQELLETTKNHPNATFEVVREQEQEVHVP